MTTQSISEAVASMAQLFQGKSRDEQKALLAALERAGAAVYRALSADEPDAAAAKELLACAEREERNAESLEKALS